jgi:hypothetical protein
VDGHAAHGSLLYMLERFEVGIVQLDRELRVVAMNDFARRVLPRGWRSPRPAARA